MSDHKIWVLIAESSRARIFLLSKLFSPLEEIEGFIHSASRLHEQTLTSDIPSHGFDGKGVTRHRLGNNGNIKHQEIVVFAKTICDRLEEARCHGEFEKLILVSSPDFLGELRKRMSGQLKQQVLVEIPKNLVKQPPEKLRHMLTGQLPGPYRNVS